MEEQVAKQTIQAIDSPRVLIATPSLDGNLCIEYVSSLMFTQQKCSQYGILCDLSVLRGDAFIAKARNNLVRQFMDSECNALFFIDADQGWDADAFVRMVLDSHEIVAGAVPKKTDNIEFNGVNLSAEPNGDVPIENGLLKASRVGTGFMRIKRSAIQKMIDAGAREYLPGDGSTAPFIWEIFETKIIQDEGKERGQFWGEDLAFCEKWRLMGGDVWIDPSINFTHVGRKSYKANFYDFLKQAGAVKTAPAPTLEIVNDFPDEAAA
ncbi:MAG: hypothetical protein KGI71_04300 [Patescibacteria group bacterium]|nr:hypothetical protein [Patescibacteria group bacterium]